MYVLVPYDMGIVGHMLKIYQNHICQCHLHDVNVNLSTFTSTRKRSSTNWHWIFTILQVVETGVTGQILGLPRRVELKCYFFFSLLKGFFTEQVFNKWGGGRIRLFQSNNHQSAAFGEALVQYELVLKDFHQCEWSSIFSKEYCCFVLKLVHPSPLEVLAYPLFGDVTKALLRPAARCWVGGLRGLPISTWVERERFPEVWNLSTSFW